MITVVALIVMFLKSWWWKMFAIVSRLLTCKGFLQLPPKFYAMQAPPNRKLMARLPAPPATSSLAAGPTILMEDSIVFPSQTPGASQIPGRTPRARTILTAEAEEEAIQLTSEGKITTKNAWNIKLLDGINDSISNALSNAAGQEDAAQFTKCANLVEGGAKIWTQRVENTAARSHQVVRRLLRNDGGEDDDNADEDAANPGDNSGNGERKPAKKQRKKERTVAESLSEINLDPVAKAQASMQSGTVSAQFRAITERFDQGHAQGLLLNNAPMGALGNLILDVDYAPAVIAAAAKPSGGATGAGRGSHGPHADHLATEVDVGASPSRSRRLSTAQLQADVLSPSHEEVAPDLGFDDLDALADEGEDNNVLLDPPNQRPSWGSLSAPASNTRRSRNSTTMPPPPSELTDLMVPNMSQSPLMKEELGGGVEVSDPPFDSSPQRSQSGPLPQGGSSYDDDDGDYDMGGGDFDDDDGGGGYDDNRSVSRTSRAASSVRDLVSGAAELAFFDSVVGGGGVQLAVAAEDPNTWFPMSQVDAALHHAPNQFGSNLQKIRREMLLQQRAASSSQQSGGNATAGSTQQPQKKRARTDGVVLTGSSIDEFIAPDDNVTLSTNENKLTNSRRENLKKTAEEFKYYFYYTHSTKLAREHNILLPNVDGKGVLPWWFQQQALNVANLFQPFACSSIAWNVLNKRVATAEDAARLVHRPSGTLAGVAGVDDDAPVGDMPLRVFDDDELGDADFGDDGLVDHDDDGDGIAYAIGFDLPRGSLHNDDDADPSTSFGHFVSAADAAGSHTAASSPQEGELDIMMRPEMVRVLESHHASVPTQVDVVRLRRIMWQQTQQVIKQPPEMIMVPTHGAVSTTTRARRGRRFGKLKSDAAALKRPRDEDGSSGDSDGSDDDEQLSLAERQQRSHAAPTGGAEGFSSVAMHRFSDVVASVLPHVPTISTTGTLSPAFFFFSLLFLANEHGILLDNVPGDVQDIYITGLLNDLQRKQQPVQA